MIARLILLLVFTLFARPALAADESYADTNFSNVAKTMVRFNALDLKDDALLDEYAMATDCDLFKYFFPDDFKWNQVRAAVRESVRLNIATFPTQYHYDTKVQLGRYDFKQKNFRFGDRATIRNVNTFLFFENDDYHCGSHAMKYLPVSYHAVLDVPVSVSGLPYAESDANALLHRMDENGNTDHIVYTRFRMRVVNIDPLRRINPYGDKPRYSQNPKSSERSLRLDVRLDVIDFFEDEDMTKLLYSYRP